MFESLPREVIKKELGRLIGLPMWGPGIAAGMLMLQFGDKHPKITKEGKTIYLGDYALHVQTTWSLSKENGVVVGSLDFNESGDRTDLNAPFQSLVHELANEPKVLAIEGIIGGSFSISLEGGFYVLSLANCSSALPDIEFWRVFRPLWDSPHFVVNSDGIR